MRDTIPLGGASEKVEVAANQFAGSQTANRIVLTLGKFAVTDVFDTNKYAHDPRTDWMNWALVDTGSFDYAADAWGYTYGRRRSGIRALGPRAPGYSIFRLSPTARCSIRTFPSFRRCSSWSTATTSGASPAKSPSPAS